MAAVKQKEVRGKVVGEWGRSYLRLDRWCYLCRKASRQREWCGHSPGHGSWCQAWNSEKGSLGWSERFGLGSALSTQIITYATLLAKLWRPPFMDLEISLYVSAFACQAQIFPRGKKDRWSAIFLPSALSIQSERMCSWDLLLPRACLLCLHSVVYKYAKKA